MECAIFIGECLAHRLLVCVSWSGLDVTRLKPRVGSAVQRMGSVLRPTICTFSDAPQCLGENFDPDMCLHDVMKALGMFGV